MSRSQRFFNGVAFAYSYQAVVMLAGLWLTPFLLHHLGKHDYGLWLMGLQILSYLLLTDLGIVVLLPRTVAYATGRAGSAKQATDLPPLVAQTATIMLWQTAIVALAAILVWIFLPAKWSELRGPIGIVMAAFTFFFPFRIFAAVLEGLQEQAFVIRATMASWGLSTLANVIAVLAGWGLYSLAIGSIVSQAVSAGACFWRLLDEYPEVLPRSLPRLSLPELWPRLGRGFWMSASQIGQSLFNGADLLILGKVMGPVMVVPYSCTGKLANVLSNQPQLLMQMAVPGLSELKAGSSKGRLSEVTISLAQGMLLISGLLFCVTAVVNGGFVSRWVGLEQYAGLGLTCVILMQVLLRHFNLTFAYATFCYGYERRMAITGLLDGVVSVAAMWLLIPHFGYLGAAAGSMIGVCAVSLPMNISLARKELDISVTSLMAPFWPWCWRFALVGLFCVLTVKLWVPRTLVQILVSATVAAVFYISLLAKPTLQTPVGQFLQRYLEGQFARLNQPKADVVVK